jgi:hypothetical protein
VANVQADSDGRVIRIKTIAPIAVKEELILDYKDGYYLPPLKDGDDDEDGDEDDDNDDDNDDGDRSDGDDGDISDGALTQMNEPSGKYNYYPHSC